MAVGCIFTTTITVYPKITATLLVKLQLWGVLLVVGCLNLLFTVCWTLYSLQKCCCSHLLPKSVCKYILLIYPSRHHLLDKVLSLFLEKNTRKVAVQLKNSPLLKIQALSTRLIFLKKELPMIPKAKHPIKTLFTIISMVAGSSESPFLNLTTHPSSHILCMLYLSKEVG